MKKKPNKIEDRIKALIAEATKDLKMDLLSLDTNCLEQPDLYLKWSERLNLCDSTLKRIQNNLTQFKASAYLKAKDQAEASFKKITEAQASAEYRVLGRYKILKVQEESCERKRQALMSIVNAFMQRRSMLETLCRLHGQDYFQGS